MLFGDMKKILRNSCSGTPEKVENLYPETARGHDWFTAYLNSSVQLDLQDGLGNISPLTLFDLG